MIWVLEDKKIGTSNQAIGVAEALGMPYIRKKIEYNRFSKLPNFLKFGTVGIANLDDILDDSHKPSLIISAGRRTVNLACYLKKRYNAKTIHIMNFGKYKRDKFDLIITPSHDGLNNLPDNMETVSGSPHTITDAILQNALIKWESKFSSLKHPVLALIIGGSTKNRKFTKEMAEEFSEIVSSKFKNHSILITTSRRTGEENEQIIFDALMHLKPFIYDFRGGLENPYHGFLAYADKIIVTGDSMTMCSEASFTGKPVFIYAPKKLITKKHERLHNELLNQGIASFLNNNTDIDFKPSGKRLNPSLEIACVIKKRITLF